MIKFDNIEEKRLEAFKGGEGALCAKMITDELNKILLGRLKSILNPQAILVFLFPNKNIDL